MLATTEARFDIMNMLLTRDANVNCKDDEGRTVLYMLYSARPFRDCYSQESVKTLLATHLSFGADIRITVGGKSILDIFVQELSYFRNFRPSSVRDMLFSPTYQQILKHSYLDVLYSAGAPISSDTLWRYRRIFPQFILDDIDEVLPTLGCLCRQQVRSHVLDPAGGNQKNLFIAVPHLPLPEPLKQFILFDVDLSV